MLPYGSLKFETIVQALFKIQLNSFGNIKVFASYLISIYTKALYAYNGSFNWPLVTV